MKRERTKHQMDGVYVLLLFAVFAGCILLVLMFGASSYEKLVARDSQSYEQRIGVQYIAAKIRHNDSAGCISVGSFSDRTRTGADDIDTLYLQFISEEGPIPGFYTKIYYYDGYIREVLCAEDAGLYPEDGGKIMEASGLTFSCENGLITIAVTLKDGSTSRLCLATRSTGTENRVEDDYE